MATADLTYYIFEGVLTGFVGAQRFHMTALSGGGGGSTNAKHPHLGLSARLDNRHWRPMGREWFLHPRSGTTRERWLYRASDPPTIHWPNGRPDSVKRWSLDCRRDDGRQQICLSLRGY
jgi:hypothetical protein